MMPAVTNPADNPPSRGIFLLPNLLTTGCLFSGFYSIVAAIDARRGNVDLQLYTPLLAPLREPRICPLAEAARSIPEGRYLAVGSAARTLIAAEHPQAVLIKAAASDQTTAATVARLAAGGPARFEHEHRRARLLRGDRGGEAGEASADHADVDVS